MDWYPASNETLLVRTPISFATGFAPPVAGMRWYRDPARNDIQGELSGWPPGPVYTSRSKGDQAVGRAIDGAVRGFPVLLNVVSSLFSNTLAAPFREHGPKGEPQEPENEVEDFPVMWAAPGTTARTLPWQLDPARTPKRLRVDLVATERRLLVLAGGADLTAPADILWEVPREAVRDAERREFCESKADVKIFFADGSWVRLYAGSPDRAIKLVQALRGEARTLTEGELTPGQRERVFRFTAELPGNAEPPTFTRMPSGIVLVEARVPAKRGMYETNMIYMGSDGSPAIPAPDDLS